MSSSCDGVENIQSHMDAQRQLTPHSSLLRIPRCSRFFWQRKSWARRSPSFLLSRLPEMEQKEQEEQDRQ